MKIEVILENLDLFSSELDRVSTLRDFIIELSVKGELVVGDSSDTPADVLLASTALERIKLEKLKAIRVRKTLPGEYSDPPYQIPKSWAWARLSDVGYELGQKTPEKTFTYIDVGSIDPNFGRISDRVEQLEANQAPSRARKVVAEGTVIYSTVRPYLRNIAIVEKAFEPEPIASTAFGILHPFSGINNRYLFYWLRSKQFNFYVEKCMKGVAYPAINDEKFYGGYIPVPPTKEQDRIVAKVDELMALCDRLEAQLKERDVKQAALAEAALAKFTEDPTPDNLQLLFHPSFKIEPKNLREVVLNMAIKGLVTNQSENEEPVDKALGEMLARRKRLVEKKLIRQPKPASPISEDDHPFKAPVSWRWARWGTICDWITYGFTRPMAHVSKGPPIVTAKNVQDGHLTFTNSHCADQKEYSELNPKDLPLRGDILITKDGTIGRAALVDTDEEFCINQSVAVLWLRSCLLYRPFLLLVIRSPFTQKPVKDAAEGMAIKHLSVSDFAEMLVALPPLDEQKRIVDQVEILMSIIDNLEAQLDASRTTGEKLLEAMVAELTAD